MILSICGAWGVSISGALAADTAALPADFPAFDIAKSCANFPDRSACERLESEAKTRLIALWGGLSAGQKKTCRALGEKAGNSYVTVSSCAEPPTK